MKRLILLGCWAICLASCSGKEPEILAKKETENRETEEKNRPDIIVRTGTSCRASIEDPFLCVQKACSVVSGKFDSVMHTCECPSPADVFTPYQSGKCLPAESFNSEMSQSRVSKLFPDAKIPIMPLDWFQMNILLGERPGFRTELFHNLFVTEIALGKIPVVSMILRSYWEPDPERWSHIIQRRIHLSPSEFSLPNDPIIVEAWERVLDKSQPRKQRTEFFTQDGCAGHCIIEYRYPSFKNHRVLEINEYVGGLSIRHQVLVEELGLPLYQSRHAVIEVDPSGSPNLVYLFRDNLEIYSRTGELLETRGRSDHAAQLSKELEIRDRHKKSSGVSIIICDAGLVPSAVPRFRVGPRTDKSFWGWVDPSSDEPELSLWEQLSGIAALSPINFGYLPFADLIEKHGASVANLATQNTDFSAISITSDQCFSHYKQWKNNVKPFARVINVSAFFYYDQLSCAMEPRFKDSVGDPEQPFFWVLGAGNDSRANLTSGNSYSCPQSWGPRSNMIIVTATTGGYGNSGVDYADIAADGHGYYPGEQGTSFAAPKVARVAALLVQEYPSLSNEQIRTSIIQGARIPNPRLPVRSGGILDEAGARRVARKFHEDNLK